MKDFVIKALWLSLLIGVVAGVGLSFYVDAPRLTDEQIEHWELKQQNP
jgi:hypothetical protein